VIKLSSKFYSFLALNELLSESEVNTTIMSLQRKESNSLAEPYLEDIDDLLSYGIVIMEENKLKFKHKSFAEFFYVKLTCDCVESLQETRNALFALGYKCGLNIEEFFFCVLENTKLNEIISNEFSRWIPHNADLSRYQSRNGKLLNEILSTVLDYTSNCNLWRRLLINDFLTHETFRLWLQEQDTNWLSDNVFKVYAANLEYLTVNQLVASFPILAQLPIDMSKFMENQATRNKIRNCCSTLQFAKQVKSKEHLKAGYSNIARKKVHEFLLSATCISLGVSDSAHPQFNPIFNHEVIESSILKDFDSCWLLTELLSRDDVL